MMLTVLSEKVAAYQGFNKVPLVDLDFLVPSFGLS